MTDMSAGNPHGSATAADVDAAELGPSVELGGFHLTAPEGWTRKQPRTSFTLAEFGVPRAGDDSEDARLTVTIAGGSIDDNIERWRQQVGDTQSKPETLDLAGVQVSLVDFTGTYADQHGFGSGQQQQGFRLVGAIIPLGDQLGFIKCTGPDKTVSAHLDEFRAFVKTLTAGEK